LSKIQPDNAPHNVEFIKDDCEEEWFYPFKFDFIHARAVFTCFNDQKTVMKHAYDNLVRSNFGLSTLLIMSYVEPWRVHRVS
jgi:hypothetical protein